jgi:hypothetical protein
MGTNSFAQTDSQTLPAGQKPLQGIPELTEQLDDIPDEVVSIQVDEESIKVFGESIQNLTNILPYLAIIIAGIIGGIILFKKRSNDDDEGFVEYDEEEDFVEYDDDEKVFTPRSKPMAPNFQEMQKDSHIENIEDIEPDQIIENKLRIISKLEEYKIGDNHKLEEIKQLLIADGSFTQEANDYLEAKYEEYKKLTKKKSNE